MKFGRMLVLSLATMLVAVPAVYAQDDDMGDLTTKKPTRRQTVEEENNDPTRSGPYLGLGATYAHSNFDLHNADERDSGGYNATVGYRFNRWVGTDVHVERYQKFSIAHTDDDNVNGWALGFNGRVFPLAGRFQPFGVIGLNYLNMETNRDGFQNEHETNDGPAMRFGIGLDAYATNKLVVTTGIDYMVGMGDVSGYDMLICTLGFLYRP